MTSDLFGMSLLKGGGMLLTSSGQRAGSMFSVLDRFVQQRITKPKMSTVPRLS